MKTRKELDELLDNYMMDCDSETLMVMVRDFTKNLPDAGLFEYLCNGLPDSKESIQTPAEKAVEVAVRFGGIDGNHHKAWVIDQMVRILTGDKYDEVVADAKSGKDGPETFDWDIGIAP